MDAEKLVDGQISYIKDSVTLAAYFDGDDYTESELDEIAEYLEVTEEVLEECLVFYRNKYGTFQNVDNYVVYFIPNLVIMKKI